MIQDSVYTAQQLVERQIASIKEKKNKKNLRFSPSNIQARSQLISVHNIYPVSSRADIVRIVAAFHTGLTISLITNGDEGEETSDEREKERESRLAL